MKLTNNGEYKKRPCLGHSESCFKQVLGYAGDRICKPCKELNERSEYDNTEYVPNSRDRSLVEFWKGLTK